MNHKLWLDTERKCFLARFKDSIMQTDTDGNNSYTKDFWRVKTYVKDEEKLLPTHLRSFPEPYQVAQKYCGGTWNEYNSPFTIQVGQCNLNCHYCFVDSDLRNAKNGEYFTGDEIVELFFNEFPNRGMFRISGGEPFLAPGFILDVARKMSASGKKGYYLWVDTNLLGSFYKEVLLTMNALVPYGVCGCFKGFDEEDFAYQTNAPSTRYANQFRNARKIIQTIDGMGEAFFYIPEITEKISEAEVREKIRTFIQKQQDIHQNLPLRTTVLELKEYNTNKDSIKKDRLESGLTKKIWLEELANIYPIMLRWLPQCQISLR